MDADYDHCQTLVRERDRERFLATLFAPESKRPHLYALYAFDLEISHVPDAVREPMAGEIRFQWWREVLAGERQEEAGANPVTHALLDTIERCSLPAEELIAVIDARQFELLGQPMESSEKLNKYLDATSVKVIDLAAHILDSAWEGSVAARHAGRATGLARILRNITFDVSKGRLFLPLDLLAASDVHTASVLGGENSDGLRTVLAELRARADTELSVLRQSNLPAQVLPAFLHVTLTSLYLARMRKSGYDPFRSDVSVSALRIQFALWRAARAGKL